MRLCEGLVITIKSDLGVRMEVGDVYKTPQGEISVRVILNSMEVVVRFTNTGFTTLASMSNIISGKVKNKTFPSVYGVGYIGVGQYSHLNVIAYAKWRGMLCRCYNTSDSSYHRYGARGVFVCKEWHNFQNFAKWYYSYKKKEDGWHLDKDILFKGNREYCPEKCCIVPRQINASVVTGESSRGEYPIGVTFSKRENIFYMQVQIGQGRSIHSRHKTEEQAFLAYKDAKETQLLSLAFEWAGRVDHRVIVALKEWSVEWND